MHDTGKTEATTTTAANPGGVGVSAPSDRMVGHMLRPLDVIETRSLAKLIADGDQDGARVIVTSSRRPELEGKVGTVRALPVFGGGSSRPIGTTRVRLELEPSSGGCELVELEGEELDDVVGISRVRCKADGRHGIAWQDRHGLLFLPEGRAYRDALPISRSDVEASGDFDAELVSLLRVDEGVVHDRVHVWNRGGKAGELVVRMGDGHPLALALTEILAGRMCAGRDAAARALRGASDDFDKAQERLVRIADELDAVKGGDRDTFVEELRDLIVSLGDASCACSVSAKRVEREIGGAK